MSDPGTTRRRFLGVIGGTVAVPLAGCSSSPDAGSGDSPATPTEGGSTSAGTSEEMTEAAGGTMTGTAGGTESMTAESGPVWRTTELTDVLTGETFSIDGLEAPVAVQSFAVWCPKCQRQSEELSGLGESVTVVSLNTDPNEDAAKVRRHAEENGFDWRFAVAPTEMTESLMDQFGPTVTNAPSTPIIVACDDGVAAFFAGSQQSVAEIRSAAAEC